MNEREILEKLREQFGVEILNLRLKLMGKNRIYAYRECGPDIEERHSGVYFGKIERDGIRLSIEGCYLLNDELRKNVVELSRDEMIRWLRGEDIERDVQGYVVLKWKTYWLGCGRGNGKIIRNFVPKDRRLRGD
ncbi:methyltransferase RsmF C-terminal domain-like protein [Geoglobus acetivorans]|uniref:rRNA small subunit methyltransferase F RNA-binding PUA-like domain-containing protein n=1 Tax=Geoglobus acetivorans TaxID=565033 RepID=A0ABZ3H351_GEOAI|nr:hypothetical protein [Geoglobus acetivorans]